jgi:hypothetical protein
MLRRLVGLATDVDVGSLLEALFMAEFVGRNAQTPRRPATRVLKLLSCPVSAPEAQLGQLLDQPATADPKLGPHPPDRPALLDMAALQVGG